MLDQCIDNSVESIQLKDDGCIHLSVLNIETAIRVKEYLNKSCKHKNYNVQFDHDPCARRLQQVSHVQNVVQSPHPQLNALASGSYLQKQQISNTTSTSPISVRKSGYHSYEDRDDTRTTQVTSLDYDDEVVDSGVDIGTVTMKTEAEPVTSVEDKSLLDVDCNEGDEVVSMGILQQEAARITNRINAAVANDPAKGGHQPHAEPLSVPERKDTPFEGNLTEVPTVQPAGPPIPPGIIELAKALLSVSELPVSSPPQAKCSESDSKSDDATLPPHLSLASNNFGLQQLNMQCSASPSPSPHLVTPSIVATTSTIPIIPRVALRHDSKYYPSAATSLSGPNPSATPLQQNYRRHPSPPSFGFEFTPPAKSVQSKSKVRAGEAGFGPRGRKMVRYDDLYDTLPSTTSTATSASSAADHVKNEGERREKTTTASNAQQVKEEEVEICHQNSTHTHTHTHTPIHEEQERSKEHTDASMTTLDLTNLRIHPNNSK